METAVNRDGPWCYYCEEPIADAWTAQRVTDGDGDVIAYAHPGCDGDDAFPTTDLDEDLTAFGPSDAMLRRLDKVRANFPIEVIDEVETCTACGLDIYDHDPEVCQGAPAATADGAEVGR